MTDPHELVCVFNATSPTKAELIRNLLEAEGIRAVTADTHNPFPGLSIMPSEVYVERGNETLARSIVEQVEQSEQLRATEADEAYEGDEADEGEDAESER